MTAVLGWFDDRLNPILVKEIRQAMRGRYFRWVFVWTIMLAMSFGLFTLLLGQEDPSIGQWFFTAIYGCMVITVTGLIPFQAYVSVGLSWEQESMDVLNLTTLRPYQMVLGRLGSSVVLEGLVVLALLPFLAMGYLLPGSDPLAMLVVVVMTVIYGLSQVSMSIFLSWLTQNRLLRVLILAGLGMHLFGGAWTAFVMGLSLLESPATVHTSGLQFGLFWAVAGCAVFMVFSSIAAMMRLAHPEENRSTAVRVLVVLWLFGGLVLSRAMLGHSISSGDDFYTACIFVLCLALPVMSLLVTEPETMGRRVRLHVPRNGMLAALLTPWFPGGGNGVVFCVTTIVVYMLGVGLMPLNVADPIDELWFILFMLGCYALCALLFPSAILSPWTRNPRIRAAAVVAIPVSVIAVLVFPTTFGLIAGMESLGEMKHIGNPGWVLSKIEDGEGHRELGILLVITAVGALINVPRMILACRRMLHFAKRNRDIHAASKS